MCQIIAVRVHYHSITALHETWDFMISSHLKDSKLSLLDSNLEQEMNSPMVKMMKHRMVT